MKALRPSRLLPILGGAVAGGAIALAVASGSPTNHSTTTTVVQPSRSPGIIPTSLSTGRGQTINQIYRAAGPGVVDIVVTSSTSSPSLGLFGGQKTKGEGAGVVYDTKGDILTDEHVVANATAAVVTFQDGRKAPAKVLGTDPSTDSAVIHVDVPSSELHPIPFANSAAAQVGDPVVAIGSPFSLPETTTAGIVSAVGRSIPAPPPNGFTIPNAVQTDAAINPGNSGGPLLDASGHVLGLNDQIQTQSGSNAGVGFAVPSNTVAQIANGIIAGHPVKHPYVGISLDSASTGGAGIATHPDAHGLPPVKPGSPAAVAGLRPGDLVTAINSKSISSTEQFIVTVGGYSPGDTVTLTVKRGGQTHQIKVKLATRPPMPAAGG
ncbi:MAG: trypsin-like peptidase domain-containing protein [Actinomycetota bacterium]|nr:trypsin-like peptidase domain-containing protein [Actinomycetota bacterium]